MSSDLRPPALQKRLEEELSTLVHIMGEISDADVYEADSVRDLVARLLSEHQETLEELAGADAIYRMQGKELLRHIRLLEAAEAESARLLAQLDNTVKFLGGRVKEEYDRAELLRAQLQQQEETRLPSLVNVYLRTELIKWLDDQVITSENIGDLRRSLFVPWDSQWNGIVRDETAQRENRAHVLGGSQ